LRAAASGRSHPEKAAADTSEAYPFPPSEAVLNVSRLVDNGEGFLGSGFTLRARPVRGRTA
jgi:hypothetical protein